MTSKSSLGEICRCCGNKVDRRTAHKEDGRYRCVKKVTIAVGQRWKDHGREWELLDKKPGGVLVIESVDHARFYETTTKQHAVLVEKFTTVCRGECNYHVNLRVAP